MSLFIQNNTSIAGGLEKVVLVGQSSVDQRALASKLVSQLGTTSIPHSALVSKTSSAPNSITAVSQGDLLGSNVGSASQDSLYARSLRLRGEGPLQNALPAANETRRGQESKTIRDLIEGTSLLSTDELVRRLKKSGVDVNNSFMSREVYKTFPGSSTSFSGTLPDGTQIVSTGVVDNTGAITLSSVNKLTGESIFSVALDKLENAKGWTLRGGSLDTFNLVPIDTPLDALTTVFWAFSYTMYVNNSRSKRIDKTFDGISVLNVPRGVPMVDQQGNDADLGPCVGHDLVCTGMEIDKPGFHVHFPFGGDHTQVVFFAPCLGYFSTNIEKCCVPHDIGYWCAHDAWEVLNADTTVIHCVVDAVYARAFEILGSLDDGPVKWLCWLEMKIVLGALEGIVGFLVTLAVLIKDAWMGWIDNNPDSPMFNFNHAHDESCLCRNTKTGLKGTKPTVQCPGANRPGLAPPSQCRDLCKELGLNEDCYDCTYECAHDGNGKYIPPPYVKTDPAGKLKCCPGSAGTKDFDGKTLCQSIDAAEARCNCSQCGYCCGCVKKHLGPIIPPPGKGGNVITLGTDCDYYAWQFRGDKNNCCAGTAGARPEGPCNASTTENQC